MIVYIVSSKKLGVLGAYRTLEEASEAAIENVQFQALEMFNKDFKEKVGCYKVTLDVLEVDVTIDKFDI